MGQTDTGRLLTHTSVEAGNMFLLLIQGSMPALSTKGATLPQPEFANDLHT